MEDVSMWAQVVDWVWTSGGFWWRTLMVLLLISVLLKPVLEALGLMLLILTAIVVAIIALFVKTAGWVERVVSRERDGAKRKKR